MSVRKPCTECPWTNNSNHNDNLIESIKRWVENGSRPNTEHRCHMISSDLWNCTTENNVCIGSLNKENGKDKD